MIITKSFLASDFFFNFYYINIIPGPAPYRGYQDSPDDFPPPPPPPTTYMDQNFPPPPPETRENIYHEIRDDFPPPPTGPPPPTTGEDYRGPEPMYLRPGGKYC